MQESRKSSRKKAGEKISNLPYIAPAKARQYSYFVIPRMIICDPAFAGIDCAAKLIYSLMLSRLALSAENSEEYTDDQGNLFIVYPVEEIGQTLQLSKPTVVKMVNQLENAGLIIKKRQGQGKPTLIYVMDFTAAVEENPAPQRKAKKNSSQQSLQENSMFDSNSQDLPSVEAHGTADRIDGSGPENFDEMQDEDIEELTEQVKENIEFEVLEQTRGKDTARTVLNLIISILTRAGPVYIGKNQYPERLVKQRFSHLTYEDVDFALEKLFETPGVRNQIAYLTALLFHNVGGENLEINAILTQEENQYRSLENRNQFRFF